MHPNPVYRQAPQETNLAFARSRGFGTLAVNGEAGPMVSHVPFVLSGDGLTAEMHLVRSNPIARALAAPLPAVLAVTGPDAYVSPDWYAMGHDQVPTWNYVAVHLRGTLALLGPQDMPGHLDRLAASFEPRLAPKRPWTRDKMPQEAQDRMMRQIVPVRLTVTDVQGTWKLGQNKPRQARTGAADGIAASPLGQERDWIARLMRETPEP